MVQLNADGGDVTGAREFQLILKLTCAMRPNLRLRAAFRTHLCPSAVASTQETKMSLGQETSILNQKRCNFVSPDRIEMASILLRQTRFVR